MPVFLLKESIRWCSCMDERKGGALALYADVNKNSHFQPVCALTDHSKHYAQHRGWTTLDYFDWSHFFFLLTPSPGERRQCGQTPLQVFDHWMLSSHFGCCAHISVMSRHIIPKSALCRCPLCVTFHVSPSSERKKRKKKKQARLCTLIKKTSSSLLERKRASRRAFACQPKHIFQSFRSLLHITSSLSLSWIGLFFYEMWLFSF